MGGNRVSIRDKNWLIRVISHSRQAAGQRSSCNDSIYMMAIIILPCTDCSSQLNYELKHGGTLLKNGCPTWIQKPSLVYMLVNAKKKFSSMVRWGTRVCSIYLLFSMLGCGNLNPTYFCQEEICNQVLRLYDFWFWEKVTSHHLVSILIPSKYTVCVSYSGPRSRVGDRHSPCYAMMASEVRAASNRANLQSPAMRDSDYEVESPWEVESSAVQYCRTLNFDVHTLIFVSRDF